MSAPDLIGGADLQEVYETFFKALTGAGLPAHMRQLARWALVRIGAYELADKLCDFATFGEWTIGTRHPIFLQQLPRVRSHEDRLALIEQHRRWAAWLEQSIGDSVIERPAARREGKLRLGLISPDLPNELVGHFALPLFEHRDPRFELYAYALGQSAGGAAQALMAANSTFRHWPGLAADEAAKRIAEDDLDMLVELSGLSGNHVLEVMARRPARRQASWLGYPHSTGLSAIDYIVVDPQLQTALLTERPLSMPHSWIALPRLRFNDDHVIEAGTPEERQGRLTFGTLNNPYKYTSESLATWARIVAACPGSQFLFVRPEAAAPSFQRGMIRRFEAAGVSADRLVFNAERGRHMALYNQIDIALDTFPLTGGTTTCDALWMGVPVVGLVGEALFERLTYSLLVNAGVPELATQAVADYEAVAIALANDPARRAALRRDLRPMLKAGPLGQPERTSESFYDLMARTIASAPIAV